MSVGTNSMKCGEPGFNIHPMTAYVSGGRVDLPLDVQATADCHFVVQFALQRIRPGFTAQAGD
jgi:hypothetical protein